jgi:hypothetical protein
LPVYPNKPKLLAVGQPASNLGYKNWFFESSPTVSFQKTNFGVSSAKGAGNTKIGFIMRIAANCIPIIRLNGKWHYVVLPQ